MDTGPRNDSEDQGGKVPQGDFDDAMSIEDGYDGPEDCPTCGYPGCNNRCVCDICGVGPNAHADNCGDLPAWMESEEDGSDEPDKRLDKGG